ncbi:hypothetical protein [Rugosimonospora africana]|uniref:Uncharacterized protein n=1 Tax=Rugosimonospora africana TaxID=556532 RepID=A0A8J3QZ91_9ACTN|nr:hypothetical protein [Rugosimonospora africana]GIH18959.1 hypothetical protein Raf01_71310 [Rugosimonospora africana]
MSQPAPITSDHSWDELLRMVEDLTRAAARTYDDIRAFHEQERPMREPDHDPDNDVRPVRLTALDTGDAADPYDPDSRRATDEHDLQDDERRREQDELQARQDEMDLEL